MAQVSELAVDNTLRARTVEQGGDTAGGDNPKIGAKYLGRRSQNPAAKFRDSFAAAFLAGMGPCLCDVRMPRNNTSMAFCRVERIRRCSQQPKQFRRVHGVSRYDLNKVARGNLMSPLQADLELTSLHIRKLEARLAAGQNHCNASFRPSN